MLTGYCSSPLLRCQIEKVGVFSERNAERHGWGIDMPAGWEVDH
jgi:hypothetical protein